VIWRFPRVADKRAPPGPRSTDYIRCDGYDVSLRFCDRRSIFHFSINPAAQNTINDIQKLFSDRMCNFTLPLHLYLTTRWSLPLGTFIYYAYIIQTELVICTMYIYIQIYSIIINNKCAHFRYVLESGER